MTSSQAVLLVLLGGLSGMGINFLADVLPGWPSVRGVHCPVCRQPLTWKEYAFGLRPCPYCGKRRWRPWAVLGGMALFTLLLAAYPGRMGFWPLWAFLLYTVFDSVVDIEHRILFPEVEILAGGMALFLGSWRRGWTLTLAGGLAGILAMGLLYLVGLWMGKRLARRGIGREDEPILGGGDVLVMGVVGFFLGWPAVLAALTAGILLAGGFSLVLVTLSLLVYRQWPHQVYLPYAPFLLLGAWWVLYL